MKVAQVRSTDVDADADLRTTNSDSTTGIDINWNGSINSLDRNLIGPHLGHWHRNALHGAMVQVTNLCGTCAPKAVNTFGSGPFWSPGGRILSYTRFVAASPPACKIFISPSDAANGYGAFQVTSIPVADHDYDPHWTPDGNSLVFDRSDTYVIRRGLPWSGDTTEVAITSSAIPGDLSPSVSPDGQWVAYSRPDGGAAIWKIRMNGDALSRKRLTAGHTLYPDSIDYDEYPSWSPDGQWIYFMRTFIKNGGKIAVYKVPADSGAAIAVSPDPLAPDSIWTFAQSVSSDGKLVIFGRGKISSPTKQVFATTLDPTVTPLTKWKPVVNYRDTLYAGGGPYALGLGLDLSPDGTRLAVGSRQVWAARRNMNLPPRINQVTYLNVLPPRATTIDDTTTVYSNVELVSGSNCYQIDATDPESDPLSLVADILGPGMSFDSTLARLCFDPPTLNTYYYGRIRVSEASGGSDWLIFKLMRSNALGPNRSSRVSEERALPTVGPNPTRGQFVFPVLAEKGKSAAAAIYDLAGRKVAVVRAPAGSALVWDGRSADGQLVEPGIYLYRLDAGTVNREGKVVVVR